MRFDDFFAAIENQGLRAVARHWNVARGSRLMPAWREIDPIEFARQLPIIWSWQYDRETRKFTGRLSGEEINRIFGKSLRGAAMEDFFAPPAYENIYRRHHRVVSEPCFAHGKGAVFIHAKRYGVGERIILPLADDGEHGDGIIGATIYHLQEPTKPGSPRPDSEDVDFYPL